jgi:hypothetical protein
MFSHEGLPMDDAKRWNTNDSFKLAPFTPAVGALRHYGPSSPVTVTSSDESSAASSTGNTSASSATIRARAVTYNQARKVFLKLYALGFDLQTSERALEYGLAPRLNQDETLAESALKYAIECTQRSEARNIHCNICLLLLGFCKLTLVDRQNPECTHPVPPSQTQTCSTWKEHLEKDGWQCPH